MQKKKIYHIHTDLKFIFDSKRFEYENFLNTIIILGDSQDNDFDETTKVFYFPNNLESIGLLIKEIEDADLVVINDLCDLKKEIVKNIPTNIKIAWRFFGQEYYGTRRDLMFSKYTLKAVEYNPFLPDFINAFLFKLKVKKRKKHYNKILKVTQRIDFILLFFEEEYHFIKKYWSPPEFVKLNINNKIEVASSILDNKQNRIIVGNSRNTFNNHLDILKNIQKIQIIKHEILLFFNYGNNLKYAKKIEDFAQNIQNLKLIKNFLGREEFEDVYATSSTLVINSYRQMAINNIVTAIKHGVKIYLNDRNPTKDWLTRKGVVVAAVSDFEKDLASNNLSLTTEQAYSNIEMFNKIVDEYSREEFCKNIERKL